MVLPNLQHRAYRPLVELLTIGYGAPVVISRELAPVQGIEAAYIYGSWAERRDGGDGSPPRDVDVLLIGNPRRGAVAEAARTAEKTLGTEVNIHIVTREAWESSQEPFLRTLRSRPLYPLDLVADSE